MSSNNKLLIKPLTWVIHDPGPKSSYINYIDIFAYTIDGRTIFIRLKTHSTYSITFVHPITSDMIKDITDTFKPSFITISKPENLLLRTSKSSSIPLLNYDTIQQDPFGVIESFWQSLQIGPYEWLEIQKYTPFSSDSASDLSIQTEDIYISPLNDTIPNSSERMKRLFFCDPTFTDVGISSISIITSDINSITKYYLTLTNLQDQKNTKVIITKSEKELLEKFFIIYTSFNPDIQIFYDEILSQFYKRIVYNNLDIYTNSKMFSHETIHLIDYYRLFYPHLGDYSIKNVLNYITKTTFETSEKLYKLWITSKIYENMESLCNNLGVTFNTLLTSNNHNILDRAMYNIYPCAKRGVSSPYYKLKDLDPGIYQNVYIYDYSEIYRCLMLISDDESVSKLGERLEGAPSSLITYAFYSSYVDRTKLMPQLSKILDPIFELETIISVDPYTIRSIDIIDNNWLKSIYTNCLKCFVSLSKNNYIFLTENNDISIVGLTKISFLHLEESISRYLEYICSKDLDETNAFEIVMENNPQKFILTEEVLESPDTLLKYTLFSQYESPPSSIIKYIMTNSGPIILSKFGSNHQIDFDFYNKKINSYINKIKSLPHTILDEITLPSSAIEDKSDIVTPNYNL